MGRGKNKKNFKIKEDYFKKGKHSTRQSGHFLATLFYAEAEPYGLDEQIIKSVYREWSDDEGNHTMSISKKNNEGHRIKIIETEYFASRNGFDPLSVQGHPHVSYRASIKYDFILEQQNGIKNTDVSFSASDISNIVIDNIRKIIKKYQGGGIFRQKS